MAAQVAACAIGWCLLWVAHGAMAKAHPAAQIQPAQATTDYRCDSLQMAQSPVHLAQCDGHVVIRGNSWLLCCDQVQGRADKQWHWQELTCRGSVRLWRNNNELIWADVAHFNVAKKQLDLQGKPTLCRGHSLLTGSHILIDWQQEAAKVVQPKGFVELTAAHNTIKPALDENDSPSFMRGPLPQTCPLSQARP